MERKIQLLNIISEEGKVSVADLSRIVGVSQVTIRKDLDELSAKGLIAREHGFAVALNNDDLATRLARNYSVKSKIAKCAAKDIRDNEVVIIESGSTCALFAEEICKTKIFSRIITNSVFIANFVRDFINVNVTLLGGEYQKESQVNIGPLTSLCAAQYKADKIFIGTDGFDVETGFTGTNIMRVDTVQNMAHSADKIIVLCDSEKFGEHGLVKLFNANQVYMVYTDDGITPEAKRVLEESGIIVKIAD